MEMAERLQKLRRKAGYSQEQTAELLGISRQAVSKWESGQGKPDLDNLVRLTEIYNTSADYILLGTEKNMETPVPEKSGLSPEVRKMLCILAIIAGTALVSPFLSGCIYSHNYDKNGNEMDREQVEETIDDTIENIKDMPNFL